MKVVKAEEMAKIEAKAFKDGVSEEDLMENAGGIVAEVVLDFVKSIEGKKIYLLCGKGNNAGDAYVTGRLLIKEGFDVVAYQLVPLKQCSPLCQKNHKIFTKAGGICETVTKSEQIDWREEDLAIIVDGIFGTGFKGEVKGLFADVIHDANASYCPIFSIDIPSGVNGNTGEVSGVAIKAFFTVCLGFPKVGCFLRNGWNYTGRFDYFDIGLPSQYINELQNEFWILPEPIITTLLPSIVRTRHKYSAGYVVGMAGSKYMPGAAMLSGLASLRSGAGIVRIVHPEDTILPAQPYELIKTPYQEYDEETVLGLMNSSSAVFVGPGIGVTPNVIKMVSHLCEGLEVPCVFDADALNILATIPDLSPPPGAVLTPHIGEMHRLLRLDEKHELTLDFLNMCQNYSEQYEVSIVLKGAPTFIIGPEGPHILCPMGNPGMATAGSGDVLTGIIAAFLSQELAPHEAAILGVHTHSLAGDLAHKDKTSYSLIASDIIEQLPEAFCVMVDGNTP